MASKKTVPINYSKILKETGVRKGKIVDSTAWGWGMQGVGGVDFVSLTAPYEVGDKTSEGVVKSVKIKDKGWVIEFDEYPKGGDK